MPGTDQLKPMLERHEGRRSKMYLDIKGNATVGVGHNLTDPIPDQAIDFIFEYDIGSHVADLERTCPWFNTLDSVRQDVLIDMCFNLGIEKLLGFHHTLAAIADNDWEMAAKHMLASQWAREVDLRATELAEMMRSGAYPQN